MTLEVTVLCLRLGANTDVRTGSTTCATTLYERAAEVESILCQPDEQLPRVRIM